MDEPTNLNEQTQAPSTIPEAYASSQSEPQNSAAYEETPIIDPWANQPTASVNASAPIKRRGSIFALFGNFILFIVLFGTGVALSYYFKQYLPDLPQGTPQVKLPQIPGLPKATPTPEFVEEIAPPAPEIKLISYQVISGVTRLPVTGISFKLPEDVLEPICDGSSCGSQGTYLPGGTRFTVAPRGQGQILADFRGSIISDLSGKAFEVKQTTIAGRKAVEFNGDFTGSTIGGYAFTKMHGVMIEVSDLLSLEINHFTPAGVDADFAADDLIFSEIVQSLELPVASGEKGVQINPPLTSPSVTP